MDSPKMSDYILEIEKKPGNESLRNWELIMQYHQFQSMNISIT